MLWQKRALTKAGHLSQRCSADSISSSQTRQRSDCFFCEVQPLAEAWWCPFRNLTRSVSSALLKGLSLIWFLLVVYKSMKRWWLLGSGLSFPVIWFKCHSAGCGRVDSRLASEFANSLP